MEQVSAVKQPLNAGQPIVSQVVNSPNNQSCRWPRDPSTRTCVPHTHTQNAQSRDRGEAVDERETREREREGGERANHTHPRGRSHSQNTGTPPCLCLRGLCVVVCAVRCRLGSLWLSPWQEWQTGKQGQHSAVMGFWGCPVVATPPSRASRPWGSGPPEELSFPPDGCSVGHGLA